MTPNILENISTWLVDWSLITIMGTTTPPRDPNDENDEDDEHDKNDDDERQDEPAVGRQRTRRIAAHPLCFKVNRLWTFSCVLASSSGR
jgi:hypothetical protein